MKSVYIVTFRNPKGGHLQKTVVASTRVKAEKEAARLCGLPEDTEPFSSITHADIDSIVE